MLAKMLASSVFGFISNRLHHMVAIANIGTLAHDYADNMLLFFNVVVSRKILNKTPTM